MDEAYDIRGAAKRLEELALDRYNSPHSDVQLSRMSSPASRYEVVQLDKNWRLIHKGGREELVVLFQGVVCKKDLPPFIEKLSKNSKHVKYLRQSITIAGLKTPTFEKVSSAIVNVHGMLSRAVGIDNVQDCGMITTFNGAQAIELSNRYFSPCNQETSENDKLPISTDIDPHGYLQNAAAAANLFHGAENSVAYFEREGADDESYKYKNAKPVIFGVGDIVEIQASFVLFQLKGMKYKTAMTLRGLTLLDGTFTEARICNKIISSTNVAPKPTLIRKVGYMQEEVSATRSKMARMEIDANLKTIQSDHEEENAADEEDVDLD